MPDISLLNLQSSTSASARYARLDVRDTVIVPGAGSLSVTGMAPLVIHLAAGVGTLTPTEGRRIGYRSALAALGLASASVFVVAPGPAWDQAQGAAVVQGILGIPHVAPADLFDRLRPLIDALRPILQDFARSKSVSVAALDLSRFVDPEESTEEAVLTQRVRLSPDAALDYWNEVGAEVQRWVGTLSAADADLVNRHLAVFVEPAR